MGPKGYVRDLGLGEALARPDEEEGCVKNRHHLATQSKIVKFEAHTRRRKPMMVASRIERSKSRAMSGKELESAGAQGQRHPAEGAGAVLRLVWEV